ncbi:MAG: methionyl-tRNA formyltransferase [Gammaproteobacteria bacterium]|nr:methionyl-tRNA formyltransferase [Gammaproteobacteria bacterium]
MKQAADAYYIVAAVGDWNRELFDCSVNKLPGRWQFADSPDTLLARLEEGEPRYIFFPHWRWIVADDIINNYECVCFHMTNLPYGRGGSPLQNLIIRGHRETVLTALRMTAEIDAGPIYKQLPLLLDGSAGEIYRRCSEQTWRLIGEIIAEHPKPVEQSGEAVYFTRRRPQDSRLPEGLTTQQTYDFIRMLDAPGYPPAFCDVDGYRMEFANASLLEDSLTASVRIIKTDDSHE